THVFVVKQTVNKKNVLLFGENAIIHFITAVCHFGSFKTTVVLCARKIGLYKELADETR
ncbi:Hypothetical predicted protein, partial [Paramuricea clavata]